MKGLSNSSSDYNRSQSTCSFCRDSEHQIDKCPHVKPVWDSLQVGIIPISYLKTAKTNTNRRCYSLAWFADNGSNWGDLYALTYKSFTKWEKAQKRAKQKRISTTVLEKTCGYCGEIGHTRAKCEHLDFHKKALVKANRNFRKWFYQEYVVQQGLSTGCIISFDLRTNNGGSGSTVKPVSVQTIITDVNWGSINLLSLLDLESVQVRYNTKVGNAKSGKLENIREFLTSRVLCKIPKANLPNSPHNIAGLNYVSSSFVGVPLPMLSKKSSYLQGYDNYTKIGWGDCNLIENFRIVQKAPQNLGSEWVDGFSDEMSVIFKKFNQEELNFFGIIEHIKDWATKTE